MFDKNLRIPLHWFNYSLDQLNSVQAFIIFSQISSTVDQIDVKCNLNQKDDIQNIRSKSQNHLQRRRIFTVMGVFIAGTITDKIRDKNIIFNLTHQYILIQETSISMFGFMAKNMVFPLIFASVLTYNLKSDLRDELVRVSRKYDFKEEVFANAYKQVQEDGIEKYRV